MKVEENDIVRINVRIPNKVVEWYKNKAKEYSFPYSSYMALLLIQHYESQVEKELVKEFNSVLVDIKNMSDGSMTSEEMVREMKKLVELAPKSND